MNIQDIRKISKLSQRKFCERYNIPLSTLRQWEQGKREPPDYLVELLEFKVKEDFGMEYTEEDFKNLIALCEQEDDTKPFNRLKTRCKKAIVYSDYKFKITEHDKELLKPLYDPDMDESAKETLEKILK